MIKPALFGTALMLLLASNVPKFRSQSQVPLEKRDRSSSCNINSLPGDVRTQFKNGLGNWRIQAVEDLSRVARKTWESRTPTACPGFATGRFQDTSAVSYAFLLIPIDHPNMGYKLLVFARGSKQSRYEQTIVERFDSQTASNYFIRTTLVSAVFGKEPNKKYQVDAADGILLVDSADHEYETDLFFWSNGQFRQEPVDR